MLCSSHKRSCLPIRRIELKLCERNFLSLFRFQSQKSYQHGFPIMTPHISSRWCSSMIYLHVERHGNLYFMWMLFVFEFPISIFLIFCWRFDLPD